MGNTDGSNLCCKLHHSWHNLFEAMGMNKMNLTTQQSYGCGQFARCWCNSYGTVY